MTYDSESFWLSKGQTYRAKFRGGPSFAAQEKALIDYLSTLSFGSVLEVGCGFGRITRLVQDAFGPERYVAFDLSSDQATAAQELVPEATIWQRSLFEADFGGFDLVLSVEVLMHIEPDRLPLAIDRLCSWGSDIVTVDWRVENPPASIAGHNFHHDYERIFARLGPTETTLIGNGQAIFHCKPRVTV